MSNQDLDMFKKLDGYKSAADFDTLWAGIEPALPTQPTQRRGLVYWPFAVVGLALLLGTFWLYSVQENKLHYTTDIVQVEGTTSAIQPQQAEQKTQTTSELSETTQKTIAETTSAAQISSPQAQRSNLTRRANNQIQFAAVSATIADSGSETTAQPTTPLVARGESAEQSIQRQTVSPEFVVEKQFDAISTLPLAQTFIKASFQIPSLQRPDPQTGCYDWSGRKGRVRPYLGVYAGAHAPLRSIASKTLEFNAFAASRLATEQKLEAVNAGAFFGLQARNGLSIDGGFEYMRINERFRASDTTITQVGQVVTIAFIVNAPGDTTFVMDTTNIMQTTINTRTTYNRYNFMSIPVGVGFTFNQTGTLKPYVKGGVQINIGTRQKVGMLDANGQYQLYESSQPNTAAYPFRTKVGMMPFIQAGARLSLGGALEAFGEVRYLHMQRDVTTDAFALKQRYRTVGAQVGLRLGL